MALLSPPSSSPTTCTRSHIHAEKCTHTPHITESEGEGVKGGVGVTAHMIGEGWGDSQMPVRGQASSRPFSTMTMAENGAGGVELGLERWGDSRQVRNSTGPPGVGGGYKRGWPIGQEKYRNQCPREKEGEQRQHAKPTSPSGAGQAHAQVTADALPGPPTCQNT